MGILLGLQGSSPKEGDLNIAARTIILILFPKKVSLFLGNPHTGMLKARSSAQILGCYERPFVRVAGRPLDISRSRDRLGCNVRKKLRFLKVIITFRYPGW